MKKKNEEVAVINDENTPHEIIAAAIVNISRGFEKLLATGLNRRALEVLIKDASGISMSDISRVLNALPRLRELYTIPSAAKNQRARK